MRKYKLITRFPGSPLSGTIVKEDALGQYIKENPLEIFNKKDIENHPIFWEEICIECGESKPTCSIIKKCGKFKEEPNYLITAFRRLENDRVIKIKNNGYYSTDEGYELAINSGHDLRKVLEKSEFYVSNNEYEIYSVKNSKGEEFTIGEDAFFKTKIKYQESKILKFDLVDNFILATTEDRQGSVDFLFKKESPLYITTDGEDIYEGDKPTLYLLNSDLTFKNSYTVPIFRGFSNADKEVADRYLTFTSEESRDKFINLMGDKINYLF